jgi:hypothetical protein
MFNVMYSPAVDQQWYLPIILSIFLHHNRPQIQKGRGERWHPVVGPHGEVVLRHNARFSILKYVLRVFIFLGRLTERMQGQFCNENLDTILKPVHKNTYPWPC